MVYCLSSQKKDRFLNAQATRIACTRDAVDLRASRFSVKLPYDNTESYSGATFLQKCDALAVAMRATVNTFNVLRVHEPAFFIKSTAYVCVARRQILELFETLRCKRGSATSARVHDGARELPMYRRKRRGTYPF